MPIKINAPFHMRIITLPLHILLIDTLTKSFRQAPWEHIHKKVKHRIFVYRMRKVKQINPNDSLQHIMQEEVFISFCKSRVNRQMRLVPTDKANDAISKQLSPILADGTYLLPT